ncbi:hypothetical protein RJG79_01560 [Mycoplasmatota bacterium WC44]
MNKIKYSTIINQTLPFVKNKGRMLDYFLILNLFSNDDYEKEIVDELLKYQNGDGGFGNGLEPDNQMPYSSTLATNIACDIIESLTTSSKFEIIKDIVLFFESTYKEKTKSFDFVTKDIMNYPHAVWWNIEGIDNFGYLNPNPEVIGFLYKYRECLTKFNIDELKNYMVDYIKDNITDCDQEHSLYSIRRMINRMESYNGICENLLLKQEDKLIVTDEEKWKTYVGEPIKFIKDKDHPLYLKYEEYIWKNLGYTISSICDGVWYPNWQWYQYNDVFENEVKYQWMGYITYEKLKLLKSFDLVDYDA